jgi:Major royal jelly protein
MPVRSLKKWLSSELTMDAPFSSAMKVKLFHCDPSIDFVKKCFISYLGHSEIYRWDTNTPFESSSFKVVYRSESCQLATHALTDYKHSRMRVLESNFPDYIQNKVGCGAIQALHYMEGCF